MPYHVAHLNLARGYRGGERQTELLVRALADAGLGQSLVCRRGEPLAGRVVDVAGLRVVEVAGGLAGAAMATPPADLMHVHEGRAVYPAWLRHLATGCPYIVTRRVPNPLGSGPLTRQAYRRASRVVGISADICARLRAWDSRLQLAQVSSVASELPVDEVNVARLRQRHAGQFVVGHVGALDNDQKGQEYLIAVARHLAPEHPEIRFVLVGGGRDEALLKSMAAGLGNVEFTGFVDNVGDWLAAFDLFALPSNREGLGSILLDAMRAGLPIVASRVGGVPELVRDGENGLLVAPADVAGLQAAILRLRNAPADRARMAERSRSLAAGFTPAAMARQYLALYEAVLGHKSA